MTTTVSTQPPATRQRVNYIDWLRVLAVLLLIPFHSARLFDTIDPFYVKNAETGLAATAFVGFLGLWHMPLLFLLAGAATWFALSFRDAGQYVAERLTRLVVPLVFGVLVVVPPQMFFARMFHGQYSGSYLDYYPSFFRFVDGSDYPGIGFSFAHLWFIMFLFYMSVLALPIFLLVRVEPGARLMARVTSFLARPGAILLLALPLPFTSLFDDPMGHNFTLYAILFGYGYFLMSDSTLQESVYRSRWLATALGVVATAGYFATALVWGTNGEGWDLASIIFQFTFNFSAWFWIVAALGFGQKLLTASNRLLKYANEAAYPFYILHQTVIVVIGYYVVQMPGDPWLKYAVVVVCSLAATLGIYDLLVRRTNVTRFLFGMKPSARLAEKKPAPVRATA